jgi:hypothetical protein
LRLRTLLVVEIVTPGRVRPGPPALRAIGKISEQHRLRLPTLLVVEIVTPGRARPGPPAQLQDGNLFFFCGGLDLYPR